MNNKLDCSHHKKYSQLLTLRFHWPITRGLQPEYKHCTSTVLFFSREHSQPRKQACAHTKDIECGTSALLAQTMKLHFKIAFLHFMKKIHVTRPHKTRQDVAALVLWVAHPPSLDVTQCSPFYHIPGIIHKSDLL